MDPHPHHHHQGGPPEKLNKESLPYGFDYDPNMPMPFQYQLLAFENQQQKLEELRQQVS